MPVPNKLAALAEKARKAAALYLEGDVEMRDCCARFGVSHGAAWRAVKRLRAAVAERSA
jgi:predicted DNA-binding protein (UPF0251 family)